MANKTIGWSQDSGQNITVEYAGSKSGPASFTSVANESIDREQTLTFKTTDGSNIRVQRTIKQTGKREVFMCIDGSFNFVEGTFNVLKPEFG